MELLSAKEWMGEIWNKTEPGVSKNVVEEKNYAFVHVHLAAGRVNLTQVLLFCCMQRF